MFDRALDGVISSLLALKLRPYIRYQSSSEACQVRSARGLLWCHAAPRSVVLCDAV
jgi:hypothetical protein